MTAVCPSCSHMQETSARSVIKCAACKLVAPASAFIRRLRGSRSFSAPRAWTISGNVD